MACLLKKTLFKFYDFIIYLYIYEIGLFIILYNYQLFDLFHQLNISYNYNHLS